jgi:hypothetical protein
MRRAAGNCKKRVMQEGMQAGWRRPAQHCVPTCLRPRAASPRRRRTERPSPWSGRHVRTRNWQTTSAGTSPPPASRRGLRKLWARLLRGRSVHDSPNAALPDGSTPSQEKRQLAMATLIDNHLTVVRQAARATRRTVPLSLVTDRKSPRPLP